MLRTAEMLRFSMSLPPWMTAHAQGWRIEIAFKARPLPHLILSDRSWPWPPSPSSYFGPARNLRRAVAARSVLYAGRQRSVDHGAGRELRLRDRRCEL